MFLNECLHIMNAILCDRIDVSKGIDVNKISVSAGCDVSHYWYF